MKVVNMPLSKLYVGLALYEDVYNTLGAFILSKGTIIAEHHISRLMMNKVERVKVLVEEENSPEDTQIPSITSIYDKVKIKSFRTKYIQQVDEVTLVIKAIGQGSYVNINEIHNISKHIMHEFDTLSDVVNYLHLVKPLDDYTYAHSLNVSLMAIIIGKWMGFNEKQLDEIAIAGLLHDLGKTKISQELLSKPGKLTPKEFDEIKKHTVLGFMMVEKAINISPDIKYAILMHHEKIDGTGYPTGATENQIPLYARIIAVADIYDAMTSNRTYRDKLCPFEVIKDFEMQTYGKLDTEVLSVFLKNIANSYLGDFVELSSGEIAEVIFINPNRIWQPIVKSGNDFIDLSSREESSNYIKQII
ncbi:MAG: metal dependent phosphohydrolase [Clostridia bacterium]|jgi:putative nucleotidyltransferase with HDIG domain|nr:metal dependent phosphohydrolase [Clostridia bacterium]